MKYVYSLNQYIKEQLIDSDKIDIDFHDTLIGGLLNRALGIGRSELFAKRITKIADQLEAYLSSMVIDDTIETIVDSDIDISSKEEVKKLLELGEGKGVLALPKARDIIEEVVTGQELLRITKDIEEYKAGDDKLSPLEIKEKLNNRLKSIPKNQKSKYQKTIKDLYEIIEETYGSSELNLGDFIEIDNKTYIFYEKQGDNAILMDIESGESITKSFKQLTQDAIINSLSKKQREPFLMANKAYQYINDTIDRLSKELDDAQIEKLNKLSKQAENRFVSILQKIRNEDMGDINSDINEFRNLHSKISHITGDTAVSIVKESVENVSIKSIRKDLEKKLKNSKLSIETLDGLDKQVKTRKGKQEISGDHMKALNILAHKGKDAMMHQKPYDDIRKNQKRYFDKLEGDRAISRKGYQLWASRINQMATYFKDILPKDVIDYIAGLADKKNIGDDYVSLNQKFLGVDKPKHGGKSVVDTIETNVNKQTKSKDIGFVGVKELELTKGSVFFIEGDFEMESPKSHKSKLKLIATVVDIFEKHIMFKFSSAQSYNYIKPKINKRILNQGVSSNKSFVEQTNDLRGEKFIDKEVDIRVGILPKGVEKGKYTFSYINLTKIKVNNQLESLSTEINYDLIDDNFSYGEISITKMGTLVGIDDGVSVKVQVDKLPVSKQDVLLSDSNKKDLYNLLILDDAKKKDFEKSKLINKARQDALIEIIAEKTSGSLKEKIAVKAKIDTIVKRLLKNGQQVSKQKIKNEF